MTTDRASILPPLLLREGGPFVCPVCGGALTASHEGDPIRCSGCGERSGCDDGIPLLFRPNEWDSPSDVTELVQAFYEKTPFPDYEDLDSSASLKAKAQRGVFARMLDEQIPEDAWILDAGCGTGQLGNFLALSPARTVIGTDICLSSLRLGQAFKRANRIDNLTFAQMNLFRPALRAESFHFVICSGVLHHTNDPLRGLESLTRLVRPGGWIVVGLYSSLGRLPTDLRRLVFRLSGDRFKSLDPRWRSVGVGERRKRAWFNDQYKHPHESKHTMGEVLRWFYACGLEFVSSIPGSRAFESFSPDHQLFKPTSRGNALDRFLVQMGMLLSGGKEGGLFVMIGQKRP